MKRVMIIDALNQFLRAYIVNPTLTSNGNPIGGVIGFLNILGKLCREIKPDQVMICWDSPGGSLKRRQMNKGYKAGRKPIKKNYEVDGMDEQSEYENKIWQQETLIHILNHMPVQQFLLHGSEADDIVSFLVGSPRLKGFQKVIVSADKDFIQLLDDETVMYRPIQDEVLNCPVIVEKFNISPQNFVLARILTGDKSDNLDGIRGVGLKTAAKRFPFLKEEKAHLLSDLKTYCEETEETQKIYTDVLEQWEKVEDNYKIMNLVPPLISASESMKIKAILKDFDFTLNATELKKTSINYGFASYDWSRLIGIMKGIQERNN
jgi:DNA polymerase-1